LKVGDVLDHKFVLTQENDRGRFQVDNVQEEGSVGFVLQTYSILHFFSILYPMS
jgi:hypothetical protein